MKTHFFVFIFLLYTSASRANASPQLRSHEIKRGSVKEVKNRHEAQNESKEDEKFRTKKPINLNVSFLFQAPLGSMNDSIDNTQTGVTASAVTNQTPTMRTYYGRSSRGGSAGPTNLGFSTTLTGNVTNEFWLRLYAEGLWYVGGGAASSHYNYEIKATPGYDFFVSENVELSLYTGLFHKGVNTINGGSLTTNYTGAVFGTSFNWYITPDIMNNLYLETYVTKEYGNISSSGISSSYTINGVTPGIGVGDSIEVQISENIWTTFGIRYQIFFAVEKSNWASNQSLINNTEFQAINISLGIGWR